MPFVFQHVYFKDPDKNGIYIKGIINIDQIPDER